MHYHETERIRNEELDQFLRSVQRRALVAARLSVPADDALDCVQTAMFRFVRKYRNQDRESWRPLFFRILYNCIRDWHRRQAVTRIFSWSSQDSDSVANSSPQPDRWLSQKDAGRKLVKVLATLPLRQQQAFVMRYWEGLDTAETSKALGVSTGTVKTHLSRAVHRLREALGEHHDTDA